MRVFFNEEFHRYELYRENPIYRNGQPQPIFVADSEMKCLMYFQRMKGTPREKEFRK